MSLVELYATEANYRSGKIEYDQIIDSLRDHPEKKDLKAAQLNADLQTSLLHMSDLLPVGHVEQFKLLGAADHLSEEYATLVGDSKTVAVMYQTKYMVWTVAALLLLTILYKL